jgi:hypothetical protein
MIWLAHSSEFFYRDEPDLEITSFAAGQWWVNPPRAHASISLNAIDAGPLDIDVPIKISAESTFIPNLATKALAIKTTISWHATGAISVLPGVQGKVNDAIKEKLVAPEGMLEVDKGNLIFPSWGTPDCSCRIRNYSERI